MRFAAQANAVGNGGADGLAVLRLSDPTELLVSSVVTELTAEELDRRDRNLANRIVDALAQSLKRR